MRKALVLSVALLLAGLPAGTASAAAGFDATYSGQSDFLTLAPGDTGTFTIFVTNTGTTTWVKGTSTQVDLAACRADKVTCDAQDETDAPFDPGTWKAPTRYATMTQSSVAPSEFATFNYSVRPPYGTIQGIYRFNSEVVVAQTGERIHPQGFYQDALVTAAVARLEISPSDVTAQVNAGQTLTITYVDATGMPRANVPIDTFVVRDQNPFTAAGGCERAFGAIPSSTGSKPCEIDASDPVTDANGQVQFWWSGSFEETHRVIAWTGGSGAVYSSASRPAQAVATMRWHEQPASVAIDPPSKTSRFSTLFSATAQVRRSDGTPLQVAGLPLVWYVTRGGLDLGTTCSSGAVVDARTVATSAMGSASFSYTGPVDPSPFVGSTVTDCVSVFLDTNGNGAREGGEISDAMIVTWSDASSGSGKQLSITPGLVASPSGVSRMFKASLKDVFGGAVVAATIHFRVQRTRADEFVQRVEGYVLTSTASTDLSGTATLSYTGPAYGALDMIDACYDANLDGDCDDPGDISYLSVAEVTVYWAETAARSLSQNYIGTALACDNVDHDVYVYVITGPQTGYRRFAHTSYVHHLNGTVANQVDGPSRTLLAWESVCAAGDWIVVQHESGPTSRIENESRSP